MQTQNWFSNCQEVGDAKRAYRDLAKQHHPDVGGDTATMQQVNAQYHEFLQRADGTVNIGSDNKSHTYHYRREVEQAIMDKVGELLALHMPLTTIEIIGTWVWVWGETKPWRKQLGRDGAKCTWHSKRVKWYWHGPSFRRKYSGVDFDTLRYMYGSKTFESEERTVIA